MNVASPARRLCESRRVRERRANSACIDAREIGASELSLHALRTKPRARMGLHMMGIGLGLWVLGTQMQSHGVVYPVTSLSWEL